jgi:hypothetical protein
LAQTRLGNAISGGSHFFDDFNDLLQFATAFSGGSGAASLTSGGATAGGTIDVTTGASASSGGGQRAQAGSATIIPTASTKIWHIAFSAKVSTAVDAQTTFTCAGVAGQGVFVGIDGSNSATKWSARFTPGSSFFLTSTINIDTSYHLFECWCNGASWFFSVDNETPVTLTSQNLASVSTLGVSITNGSTAAARTAQCDWVSVLANRF